jgi:hypothetical protein
MRVVLYTIQECQSARKKDSWLALAHDLIVFLVTVKVVHPSHARHVYSSLLEKPREHRGRHGTLRTIVKGIVQSLPSLPLWDDGSRAHCHRGNSTRFRKRGVLGLCRTVSNVLTITQSHKSVGESSIEYPVMCREKNTW